MTVPAEDWVDTGRRCGVQRICGGFKRAKIEKSCEIVEMIASLKSIKNKRKDEMGAMH